MITIWSHPLLALQHIESFQNNQPIEILGVKIDSDGVWLICTDDFVIWQGQ
ncbi:MAG TPA: hypothetical protein VL727_21675 [Puia sp.]|nr:hypothetical protein [Puia sp.]